MIVPPPHFDYPLLDFHLFFKILFIAFVVCVFSNISLSQKVYKSMYFLNGVVINRIIEVKIRKSYLFFISSFRKWTSTMVITFINNLKWLALRMSVKFCHSGNACITSNLQHAFTLLAEKYLDFIKQSHYVLKLMNSSCRNIKVTMQLAECYAWPQIHIYDDQMRSLWEDYSNNDIYIACILYSIVKIWCLKELETFSCTIQT